MNQRLETILGKLPTRSLATLSFVGLITFASWASSEHGYARVERMRAMEVRALEALQSLRTQYFALTGASWDIPSCRDVGAQ